jgi:hypothetical protein
VTERGVVYLFFLTTIIDCGWERDIEGCFDQDRSLSFVNDMMVEGAFFVFLMLSSHVPLTTAALTWKSTQNPRLSKSSH